MNVTLICNLLFGWLASSLVLGPLVGGFIHAGGAGRETEEEEAPDWFESWMAESESQFEER